MELTKCLESRYIISTHIIGLDKFLLFNIIIRAVNYKKVNF